MPYVVGAKYIRNMDTGVVFPYMEALEGLTNLEVVIATDAVTVQKQAGHINPPAALNPTATPAKKSDTVVPPKVQATTPTLAPVKVPD